MLSNKFKTTVKIVSGALIIIAIAMVLPLFISLYNHEGNCTKAFGIVALACAILGIIGYSLTRKADYTLKTRDGFLVMVNLWIIVPVIGAIPYVLSGEFSSFINAYFESISGFTTTGASVATDVQSLSSAILFWRGLTEWVGGLGFLIIISAILPIPGQSPNKGLLLVYSIFTVAELLLLKVSGLDWLDSFTMSFSTVSTGGFTNYTDNVMHFANMPVVLIILGVFMVISALNIFPLYSLKRRDLKKVFRSEEVKFFLIVAFGSAILIGVINALVKSKSIFGGIFTTLSVISTTGFVVENYTLWPLISQFILLSLFFVGACTYSAGGGLKAKNVLIGLKLIARSFKLKIHTNRYERLTLSGTELSNDEIIEVTNFTFAYVGMVLLGFFLLSFENQNFTTTFTSVLACLGNVGPGFGAVADTLAYADFNVFSKLSCAFLMVLGRLEIFPVLALFSRHFWNTNKI